ncbi:MULTISPECIES: hypothetical protein [Streptomyces]|uniref:VOC family protein n=1 Tax=Streptomyces yunnanensis TaxID=156453 RepID=A0A9X8N945_9ACTN|nr:MULTISPECIES: hypothetical protein [Streptomyces]SHN31652.1 hypothetical protein SAMN05216268_13443 [Streptomyces yunnanensis]
MTNTPLAPIAGAKVKNAAFWGHDGKTLASFYATALGWKVTQSYGDSAA